MKALLALTLLCCSLLLGGCASVPPSNPSNICDIFEDKPGWYKDAKKSQDTWGSSIPVMMSIMYQESQFVQKARTKRRKILWIFPGPRLSNAYGFAQVKTETWGDYVRDSGGMWARRDNFGDAIDFIGWYNAQSQKRSKIAVNDAYNLYLAYHEGHGGFNRKTYNGKAWLKATAQKVATRSAQYTTQLRKCEDDLQRGGCWPF